jgi:hypothetical protein
MQQKAQIVDSNTYISILNKGSTWTQVEVLGLSLYGMHSSSPHCNTT